MKVNPNTPLVLWATGTPVLVLALVALLAPEDVISRYPLLQTYTAACRAVIPGIDRLARVSSFPEVTRLVVSMMWTAVLILAVMYVLKLKVPGDGWEQYSGRRPYLTLTIIVMALSVVSVAVLYEIEPEDLRGGMLNERVLRGLSTSRLGLGMITGFFASGMALLLWVLLRWLRDFRTLYFAKREG
jgi:hypothetical protein